MCKYPFRVRGCGAYTQLVTTRATIYVRLSQDRTGEGAGIERQERECRAFCEQRGWEVREVLVDNDLSATKGLTRPGFEQLLKSSPEVVVVWHTDRLIRVTKDLERVIELGVNVHALHAGHLDLSTPAGRAVARTVTAWATYEGEQKALRQVASNQQRAKAGRPGWSRRPFGYEKDGTLRQDEAAALRQVYDMVLAGTSLAACCRWLDERGFKATTGATWTPTSLRVNLMSPRNAAIAEYRGEEVGRALWTEVIPEEKFRTVCRYLRLPSRLRGGAGARRHLLTGVLVCAECGSQTGVNRVTSGREPYFIYQCRGDYCGTIRLKDAETLVRAAVIARLELPDASDVWAGDESELVAAREEVVELRERLNGLAEDYAEGIISRAQMKAGSERLRARLEAAEERLEALGAKGVLQGLTEAHSIAQWWDELDVDSQRTVVGHLFERVAMRRRGKGVRKTLPEHLELVERVGA